MVDRSFEPARPSTTPNPTDSVLDPLYDGTDPEHTFLTEDADETDELDDYSPDPEAKTILVMPNGENITGTSENAILWLWHKTAGCINPQFLMRVAKNCLGMEEVTNLRKRTQMPQCDCCQRGKSQRRTPCKKQPAHRYKEVLYRMHTDLSGIINTPSLSGARYFAVFIDDASRCRFVALLRKKSDWLQAFDALTIRLSRHPKILRGDNAKELSVHSNDVKDYFAKHRIFNEKCSPHEHDQNPVAEGMVGSLSRRARLLLINSNAPKSWWGFALQYSAELENRFCPFMKGSDKTVWEAFHGSKPDNTFIANTEFGCRAYLHVEKQRRPGGKWVDTSIPLVYVGTALHLGYKAYMLASQDGRRVYIA